MSDHTTDHESVYSGLLENDAHWAFGTGFADPLDGVDTRIPDDVDPGELAALCLALGDDALVWGHRLSEWCSRAPDLEDDIALANLALDLIGQARLLLTRAALADPALVPALPAGSPAPADDRLAYFRDAHAFRNVCLAELPRGDFAEVITRALLLASWRLDAFEQLRAHPDGVLAAVASRGVKELAYHRDYAARWFVTLAQGTPESRGRLQDAVALLWPWVGELRPGADVVAVLDEVFAAAGLERPPIDDTPDRGRTGRHTPYLAELLAEMQSVARAHPEGRW